MLVVLQARIVGLNGQYFLKNGGNFVISIKASCIDSTAVPEAVFAREVKKLQEMQMKPKEQVSLQLPGCGNLPLLLYHISRDSRLLSTTCSAPVEATNETILLQVTLEPYERDHAVVCGVFR